MKEKKKYSIPSWEKENVATALGIVTVCKAKAGSSGASISLRLLFSDSFCFVLLKLLLQQPGE